MKEVNLWEPAFSKFVYFTNNLQDLLKAIEDGCEIVIKDKYTPGDIINSRFDEKASKENVILRYSDDNHNIAIPKNILYGPIVVNCEFFNQNKTVIANAQIDKVLAESDSIVHIPNHIFSDELFEKLLMNNKKYYFFYDVELTEAQIEKLNHNFIQSYVIKNGESTKISTGIVISYYTLADLVGMSEISIDNTISDTEFNNLQYIPDGVKININAPTTKKTSKFIYNEEEYYTDTLKIIRRLDELGKKNSVKIYVQSRNEFNKHNHLFSNVSLIIENDHHDYSYQEYVKEEDKLNKLVEHIKNSDMSPFEKYLAVYNIVKNFKPYKENEENEEESRSLRYILDNEYIVCSGYSILLITLLDRVGINAAYYNCGVDISYEEGFTLENKPVDFVGHARVVFGLKDEKYNIDGYYISDPTWDNMNEDNLFNHAIMTYDKMQVSNIMFFLKKLDYIFDVNSFEDYCKKVNVLFRKKYYDYEEYCESASKAIINTYSDICTDIMETLLQIDPYNHNKVKELYLKAKKEEKEEYYDDFLTIVGEIIVNKSNKPISSQQIADALITVKKNEHLNDLKFSENDFLEKEDKRDIKSFPYEVSETDYLVERKK